MAKKKAPKKKKQGQKSKLEESFFHYWKKLCPDLPVPERQFQPFLHIGRRHKFDFCWKEAWLACELQGGSFVGGRHNSPVGQHKDYEKNNLAIRDGWAMLYFNTIGLRDMEEAVRFVAEVLRERLK